MTLSLIETRPNRINDVICTELLYSGPLENPIIRDVHLWDSLTMTLSRGDVHLWDSLTMTLSPNQNRIESTMFICEISLHDDPLVQ